MRPPVHEVWRNVERGPGGGRTVPVRVYCTAPACAHAVGTHPIHGSAYLGTHWEPPDAGPDACPVCDAPVDDEPLYGSLDEQREALEEARTTPDPYARYDLRPHSKARFALDGWYLVTFGPHRGRMVDANADAPVLTYPTGDVVLEPDADDFLALHPEQRDDEETA